VGAASDARRAHLDAARAAADARNDLLAPQRQPQPVEPKRHDGTILAERPNPMWGIDATVGFTMADGRVMIFAMVDHATAKCQAIHVAKRGTRFKAREPIHCGVHEQFGGFAEAVACGVRLRHDHGSQFMSDDFQNEIAFLGIESSPAIVREPGGNGCVERLFRTLRNSCSGSETSQRSRNSPPFLRNSASGTTTTGSRRGQVSIPAVGSSEAACPRGCSRMITKKQSKKLGATRDASPLRPFAFPFSPVLGVSIHHIWGKSVYTRAVKPVKSQGGNAAEERHG
jgi:hypothetical protein